MAAKAHKTLFSQLPTIKVLIPSARDLAQLWSYTTHAPGLDWTKPEFDDSAWPSGDSGFGTKGTPGALVHTEWKTDDIWLRRSLELDSKAIGSPHLMIHHDEDAEVFINGKHVAALKGYSSSYQLVPLGSDAATAPQAGQERDRRPLPPDRRRPVHRRRADRVHGEARNQAVLYAAFNEGKTLNGEGTMTEVAPSGPVPRRPYFKQLEALLGALQHSARNEQKAERLRAIQAIRYVRRHLEGLVTWNFEFSGVERKDLIDWSRNRVQTYFVKVS